MNNLTIAGRIGKDAAVRQAGEYAVCNFDVAVESRVKGEKVTTWFRCAMWGERGEKLAQYLTKGCAVSVSGEVSAEVYQPRQGDARAEMRLRVREVTLLGGGDGGQSAGRRQATKGSERQERQERGPPADQMLDDDIPF